MESVDLPRSFSQEHSYVLDFSIICKKLTQKTIIIYSYVYGALNFQLGARLVKVYYPKLTVIRGVEHTVSLF